MNNLSKVLIFKIAITVLLWCIPLLFFPLSWIQALGLPITGGPTFIFMRLLGMAYATLCVGYGYGLQSTLKGKRLMAPIVAGIVSNGGACILLLVYGFSGTWLGWGPLMQILMWGSIFATGLITLGLYLFGIRGTEPIA